MELIQLKKDGIYYGKELIDNENLSLYLNYTLSIEEDVTLEELFDIINKFDSDKFNLLFNPWTRGYKFSEYYKELQKDSEDESDLIYLVVSWNTELFEYEDDDCVMQSEFSSYIDVSAETESETYGISLSSLNDLKHLKLKIDNEFEISTYEDGDRHYILKSTKEVSLNEFIGGILYEISFHGYSDDKDTFLEDLEETSKQIDSGEMEMFSNDEFRLSYLEENLENLIKNEKYEKAAKVQKEIDEIKTNMKDDDEDKK